MRNRDEGVFEYALEIVFEKMLCLPLHLTYESPRKLVRILGVLAMFPWFAVCIPLVFVMVVLLIGAVIEKA